MAGHLWQEPLWKLMWQALQDPTLIFLTCAAFISLFIGVFVEQKPLGWLEGFAILMAVVVVVTVGAVNDYQKEKQFRDLNAKKDDVTVTVMRDGASLTMSTHNLVVGDIVLLSTGDVVPADGVVLGRNDLAINEKMLTGETVMKKKAPSYVISGGSVQAAPMLFQGTFVQEGEGRLLVLAVGQNTYQGSMEEKMKEAEPGRSILQKKLDAMTDLITTVSMYVSIALVVVLLLRMAYAFYSQKCCFEAWDHTIHWSEMLGFMITGITIFVVAVPEGLPLAVTIALAFSVKKMLKDQNLVRHLSACETMGGATTICSDKTGTLTTSRMTVVRSDPPPPPFPRTNWTRLVPRPVLNGHVSSQLLGRRAGVQLRGGARARGAAGQGAGGRGGRDQHAVQDVP
jgi:calcium-translocating P-type ATPase